MLEHDAHAGPRDAVRWPARDVNAVEPDRAGIGARKPHDQRHHRRLAGAVRTDQPDDLAGAKIEAHILDGDHAAEAFAELAHLQTPGAGHSRSLRCSSWPSKPSGKNRMTASATAETTKVLSWPSGRRN